MNIDSSHSSRSPGAGALVFVVTALVSLVLSSIMLAGRPDFLLSAIISGHGQAWVKLLLLGFGFSAVFGVVYWALPCAFGVQLASRAAIFLHYALHLAGLLAAMAATFVPALSDARIASLLLACGGVVFIVNASVALRRFPSPDPAVAFLITTMVFLAAALAMGVPFASKPLLPMFAGENWSAGWIVLVTGGILFNVLLSLSFRITPLLTGANPGWIPSAWYALLIVNFGAAWTFAATTFGPLPFMLLCGGVFLLGVLFYLGCFWGVLQQRSIPAFTWDTRVFTGAVWMIAGSAAVFLWAAWHRLGQAVAEVTDAADAAAPVADAVPAVMPLDWTAGLVALLAAAVPGLVALIFQLQRLRRRAAGAPSRAADHVLLASFFNYAVGAALVIVGVWGGETQMLSLGTIFLVVGTLGLLGVFLYHLVRPGDGLPDAVGAA